MACATKENERSCDSDSLGGAVLAKDKHSWTSRNQLLFSNGQQSELLSSIPICAEALGGLKGRRREWGEERAGTQVQNYQGSQGGYSEALCLCE